MWVSAWRSCYLRSLSIRHLLHFFVCLTPPERLPSHRFSLRFSLNPSTSVSVSILVFLLFKDGYREMKLPRLRKGTSRHAASLPVHVCWRQRQRKRRAVHPHPDLSLSIHASKDGSPRLVQQTKKFLLFLSLSPSERLHPC